MVAEHIMILCVPGEIDRPTKLRLSCLFSFETGIQSSGMFATLIRVANIVHANQINPPTFFKYLWPSRRLFVVEA
jgi:hypothetical protein